MYIFDMFTLFRQSFLILNISMICLLLRKSTPYKMYKFEVVNTLTLLP